MGGGRDDKRGKAADRGYAAGARRVVNAQLTIKIKLHFPAKSIFRTFG